MSDNTDYIIFSKKRGFLKNTTGEDREPVFTVERKNARIYNSWSYADIARGLLIDNKDLIIQPVEKL